MAKWLKIRDQRTPLQVRGAFKLKACATLARECIARSNGEKSIALAKGFVSTQTGGGPHPDGVRVPEALLSGC